MKVRKMFVAAMFATVAIFLFACKKENNSDNGQGSAGVSQIIIDADLGSSTDDLLAMQLLYRAANDGRCKLLGVVVDRMGDTNAAIADLMNNYYGYASLPIALEQHGPENPPVYINYTPIATMTDSEGNLLLKRSYSNYGSLPDGWQLYRQLLSVAPDKSVEIVATGFVSAIAHLLTSTADQYSDLDGVELVRRKVKRLYFMGTKLTPDGEQNAKPGYNLKNDFASGHTFFELWPDDVDIILSPSAVGDTIEYKPELVLSDIDWTDIHPVKLVYKNFDCNTGQRMWDAVLAINAIEGDELFTLSRRGRVSLNGENLIDFVDDPDGNCRYQIVGDEAWRERMLSLIRASN